MEVGETIHEDQKNAFAQILYVVAKKNKVDPGFTI